MARAITVLRFFTRRARRLSGLVLLFACCFTAAVCILAVGMVLAGASLRMAEGDSAYRSGSEYPYLWAELRQLPWKTAIELGNAQEELRFREMNAALNNFRYLPPDAQNTLLYEAIAVGQDVSDEKKASLLLNKAGVLTMFREKIDREAVEQALVLFREAIRKDAGNEDAKWNLELLQTLLALDRMLSLAQEPGDEPGDSSPGYQPPGGGY